MTHAPRASLIGAPHPRVDGPAKVTGAARYAAEHPAAGLLHGVAVPSPVARGRIAAIRDGAARAVPGVVEVLTHLNRPRTAWRDSKFLDETAPPGHPFRALDGDAVQFAMQPVALVLAETLEAARLAALLVEVDVEAAPHETDFEAVRPEARPPQKTRSGQSPPKARGDAAAAFAAAPLQVDAEFHLAPEVHNPMEPHATTVVREADGTLTVFDKTQGPHNVHQYLTGAFRLDADKLRVRNPYVGGGFGSGLRPQYQVQLAVLAALHTERSVRVALTRPQMFTHVHRAETWQRVRLGADEAGRLLAIRNDAVLATSRYEDQQEMVVNWGLMAYRCDDADGSLLVAPRDTATPGDMRAPGAANGMSMFEMAMDEMAYAAKLDPLAFRMLNYADTDQMTGHPYTSKALREAYAAGAAAFGWEGRPLEPGTMRDGPEGVGQGMATGIWEAGFQKTAARARLTPEGRLTVACGTSDIGTGTYTVMVQVAADALGLDPAAVTAELGDSDLPMAPVEGGSWGAASTGAAVQLACRAVGAQVLGLAARLPGAPLGNAGIDDVEFAGGRVWLKADRARSVALADALALAEGDLEAEETAGPGLSGMVSAMRKSRAAHCATFVEVRVDAELGQVRVTRVVCAVAAGRILNPATARSQILGGVVMGIGMALHEEAMMDHRLGRWMNHDLAEYHVPAHADIQGIEVIFVPEEDPEVSPLGVKGLGEIGIVGTAGAVANAIWHATGRRQRALPITLDRLL